ncbi:MAG: hypothetical protein K2O91_14955 [Lachnospiraceae bacterium]|nr:hypothetical protein [Lachnospiraceae bacterium]
MLDFDYTKEYSMPMEESLRPMRIKKNPIQLEEGLVCNDQLEAKEIIQIMEYTGGSLYIQVDPNGAEQENNVVMVAEVTVLIDPEERVVKINRIYHEYGHDELVPILLGQVLNFADFYNCSISISDPRKARKLAISRGNIFSGGRF